MSGHPKTREVPAAATSNGAKRAASTKWRDDNEWMSLSRAGISKAPSSKLQNPENPSSFRLQRLKHSWNFGAEDPLKSDCLELIGAWMLGFGA
jgi:hypothetical protein